MLHARLQVRQKQRETHMQRETERNKHAKRNRDTYTKTDICKERKRDTKLDREI